ncbi:MAG TPA: sigma-70 family RNA polymerase sigma factor [Gemmataceae bacterium]|nr:sigma-70 family RNA polymerase sigma factor [Gemmataceae bacterium]
MPTVQLDSVLRYVHTVAAGPRAPARTDQELLDEFSSGRDETAFAALVSRHGPMVLRVCRRALGHEQDAEDAFQAVFLVLAQNSRSLRKPHRLAEWLHGVAYRTALHAKRTAARRRNREAQIRPKQPTATNGPSWDDVQVVLDEEIQRLPRLLREAFVVCVLENKTGVEAAADIGIPPGTLSSRLTRARQRLRQRLARRGIELSGLLAALAVAEGTGKALPGLMTSSNLYAILLAGAGGKAAGTISPKVAALARRVGRAMFFARAKTAAGLLLAVGVLATGVTMARQRLAVGSMEMMTLAPPTPAMTGESKAQDERPAATRRAEPAAVISKDADVIRVHGRVLDPAGKPIAGANVTVPSPTFWETRLARQPVVSINTDNDGTFAISFRKAQVSPFSTGGGSPGADRWKYTQIIASHEGFGVAFSRWNKTDANGDVVLKLLPDDVPIDGRIVNLEGQPVAGVRVLVSSIGPLDDKELEAAYKKDPEGYAANLMLRLPFLSIGDVTPIVTDGDGRFRIRGVGRDRKVSLFLQGETIGHASVQAATKIMAPQTRVIDQPIGTSPKFITYGARFEYAAAPGRTVQGTIKDAATGKPLARVTVQSLHFASLPQGYDPQGILKCVTDEQGRYRVAGFPKGEGNRIIAVPNDDQPYFMREAQVADEPGFAAVTLDLELHRGVWVTGKVTDKVTGQPLPARMVYTTYLDNAHTLTVPEFHRRGSTGTIDGHQSRYETRPDGSYRVVAVPGKAIVGAWCMIDGYRKGIGFDEIPVFKDKKGPIPPVFQLYQQAPYRQGTNVVKEVDVPEGGQSVTCDLQIDKGETLKVTISDPDGNVARGPFQVRGHVPENYVGWYHERISQPSFDAVGFTVDEERTLFVLDEERQLGRAVLVKFASVKDRKLTIQLQPLGEVTGRLLSTLGDPLAHLSVSVTASGSGKTVRQVETDAQGRFSTTLMPGTKYYLHVDRGPYVGREISKDVTPKPGSKTSLGDIKLERQRQ